MTKLQTSQMKDGHLPGTFAPETPVVEQVLTPQTKKAPDEDAQLDALARIICDHISLHLELELQRNGYHRCTSIFSYSWDWAMTTVHQNSPAQSSSSPSKPKALELLTQEIETLLRQRLVLEQQRLGRFNSRLPW